MLCKKIFNEQTKSCLGNKSSPEIVLFRCYRVPFSRSNSQEGSCAKYIAFNGTDKTIKTEASEEQITTIKYPLISVVYLKLQLPVPYLDIKNRALMFI